MRKGLLKRSTSPGIILLETSNVKRTAVGKNAPRTPRRSPAPPPPTLRGSWRSRRERLSHLAPLTDSQSSLINSFLCARAQVTFTLSSGSLDPTKLALKCRFGEAAATDAVLSNGGATVKCKSPSVSTFGSSSVVVQLSYDGLQWVGGSEARFWYYVVPTPVSITPQFGTAEGGTFVTIAFASAADPLAQMIPDVGVNRRQVAAQSMRCKFDDDVVQALAQYDCGGGGATTDFCVVCPSPKQDPITSRVMPTTLAFSIDALSYLPQTFKYEFIDYSQPVDYVYGFYGQGRGEGIIISGVSIHVVLWLYK